jgi:hypothetical protein
MTLMATAELACQLPGEAHACMLAGRAFAAFDEWHSDDNSVDSLVEGTVEQKGCQLGA